MFTGNVRLNHFAVRHYTVYRKESFTSKESDTKTYRIYISPRR